MGNNNSWFLHYNNYPANISLVLRDHFTKNSTHIVPQAPNSPDLAPCDFCLFTQLKGERFSCRLRRYKKRRRR